MRIGSGIIWFEDEDYIGSTVYFPCGSSTWRLDKKLSENEYRVDEDLAQLGLGAEARAVFLCTKLSGYGPEEAVINSLSSRSQRLHIK